MKRFCEKVFKTLRVEPGGDIRFCPWMRESVGNILRDTVENLWNSERAKKIRETIVNQTFEYCQLESCPCILNGELELLTDDEFDNRAVPAAKPTEYDVGCDYICNHSCPSCRDSVFVPEKDYFTKLDEILGKLIPAINDAEYIITNGNGDMFSSPHFLKFMENIHPNNPNCRIDVQTNGVLLDEKRWECIKHLSEFKLCVVVTPNSFIEPTYKYLNGGHNSYERLMGNLHFLKELRAQGSISILSLTMVVQDQNFLEAPRFVKRCLEEFGADQVTLRPIFKWFCLSEEDHWVKNVKNPLHPYHKAYLEMLNDPIMNDPRVYHWGTSAIEEPAEHPAYRYRDYMHMISRFMIEEGILSNLERWFKEKNFNNIYIYGDMDVSDVFASIVRKSGIEIKGFIARDLKRKEISGCPVIRLSDYEPHPRDAVIVLAYNFFRQIKRDFGFYDYNCELIRLDELMKQI